MISGYEPLEAAMTNDLKDRHVLTAAIRGRADVIVTPLAGVLPELTQML